MNEPTTLLEAVRIFADPQVAHDYFLGLRFPNGIACPRHGCGSADVAKISNRNAWRCRDCNRQFMAKVGTIFEDFEDSPIGFDKWPAAMWMLSSCRNGVSSCHRPGDRRLSEDGVVHAAPLASRYENQDLRASFGRD